MEQMYPAEVLQRVANCASQWDQRFCSPQAQATYAPAVERFMHKEFRLLLQCLFIHQEPDPLNPSRERVTRWLEQAHGLDVHVIRLKLLERLRDLTGSMAFDPPKSEAITHLAYPDAFHLWNWRAYHREIYRRSRAVFESATTEKVLDTEMKTWPFYDAMGLANSQLSIPSESPNVFEEAFGEILAIVAHEARAQTGKPLRILEVGCGDGRLLQLLRARFPTAELVGTNISGAKGVHPAVTQDPGTRIVAAPVENLPFEPGTFDVFLSTEVIEHLVQPQAMVEQIPKLLKPGGFYLVTAPSVHVQFLSKNPFTYLAGLLSVLWTRILPPFHNLYEPLTDLPLVHYAFSNQDFKRLFQPVFPAARVTSTRFTHLRKFRLEKLAPHLPLLRKFGGVVIASGKNFS